MIKTIKNYLRLIRVKQWVKNGLVFFPLLFARAFSFPYVRNSLLACVCFCFIASCIYIMNDIVDIEEDRKNLHRKKRPIASGDISITSGVILAVLFFVAAMVLNSFIDASYYWSYGLLILYFGINVFYSLMGKKIPIIDAFFLMSFYIIRIYYGSKVIMQPVSSYLFLTVMSCSLFLAFGKRNKEYKTSPDSRRVLKKYPPDFLDKCTYLCMTLTIVFYALWVIDQHHRFILLSVPLLLAILMRYSYVLEKREDGDPTYVFFSDIFLLLLTFVYLVFIVLVLLMGVIL